MHTCVRLLCCLVFAALLAACASTSKPVAAGDDTVVLRVEVLDHEITNYTPYYDCSPCLFVATWNVYHADIADHVSGHWNTADAGFARLEIHLRACDDCYVVLKKLKPALAEKLKVDYYADEMLYPSHLGDRERIAQLLAQRDPQW